MAGWPDGRMAGWPDGRMAGMERTDSPYGYLAILLSGHLAAY
jgi:hypothetical protein